jgi:hypothetical protein
VPLAKHVQGTNPSAQFGCDEDLLQEMWQQRAPSEDWSSAVVGIFRLVALQGWVYIAMRDELRLDLLRDVLRIVGGSRLVVRTSSRTQSPMEPDASSAMDYEDEVESVRTDEEEEVILEMGDGQPRVHRVVGEEFRQVMISLAHPPGWNPFVHEYRVRDWVCVARPGVYFGDVGLVVAVGIKDDRRRRLIVALTPRKRDREEVYRKQFARPPLHHKLASMDTAREHSGAFDKVRYWIDDQGDKYTEKGLLLLPFFPWELRKDGVDGGLIRLTAEQDMHFDQCVDERLLDALSDTVPDSAIDPALLALSGTKPFGLVRPPVARRCSVLTSGEQVLVNGHRAVAETRVRVDGYGNAPYWLVLSTNTTEKYVVHEEYTVKYHKVGDRVRSLLSEAQGTVVSFNAMTQEVGVCWGEGGQTEETTASCTEVRSTLFSLHSTGEPTRCIDVYLRGDTQQRLKRCLPQSLLNREVYVASTAIPDVKGHRMLVHEMLRVNDSVAKDRPFDSGVTVCVRDQVTLRQHFVDYHDVQDSQ